MEFTIIPNHIYGIAITSNDGCLVDICPTLKSAERMQAALTEAVTKSANWALPAWDALEDIEKQRIHRYMMKKFQR